MKTKIANALKTRYANLGLGEKAFNGVASFLEKTVKEESDIEAAITAEGVKGLLQSIQGETDSIRTAKVNAEAELEKLKKLTGTKKEGEEVESAAMKAIEEMRQKQVEMEAKLAESEKKARNAEIISRVHEIMREKGSTNDFIRNVTLKGIEVKDGDTAETLAEQYKTIYDKNLKEAFGDGYVPPRGERRDEGYKKGDFSKQAEMLRSQGYLPEQKQ